MTNNLTTHKDYLSIIWPDGSESKYHWIWLRDFCRCDICFNNSCNQKYFDCVTIPLDITFSSIEENDDTISVKWSDGHHSIYNKQWLKSHDYSNNNVPNLAAYPEKKTWNSDLLKQYLQNYQYQPLIDNDKTLLSFLEDLLRYGFVTINSINSEEHLSKTFKRIAGFVKRTYFAKTYDLITKPTTETDNVAFSSNALPLHTDLPYYNPPPEYQFLYGLDVSDTAYKVGRTQIIDGLYVAELFREKHPEYFKLLSTIKILHQAEYPEAQKNFINVTPLIQLDANNQITQFYNNPTKIRFFNIPFNSVKDYYKAYNTFKQMLNTPNCIYHKEWKQGDMIIYDNRRIFHGREKFDSQNFKRILRGGYFDNAEIVGRYFYLKHKLTKFKSIQ